MSLLISRSRTLDMVKEEARIQIFSYSMATLYPYLNANHIVETSL